MKTLFRWASNKRTSRIIFWVLAILVMISTHILPDSASPEENDMMLYVAGGLLLLWSAIYNLAPKKETLEELKKRHSQTVWLIIIAALALLGVQLYDHFYFLPKVKALKEFYRQR